MIEIAVGVLIIICSVVSCIYHLVAKQENENIFDIDNFTDVTWKDGDDFMNITTWNMIEYLGNRFPDYRFMEEMDPDRGFVEVHIRRFDEFRDTEKFIFSKDKYFTHPEACGEQIIDWLSDYISNEKPSQKTCCDTRLEPKPMKPMTCEKCGAPLKGCECEYCGTRYYIPSEEYESLYADGKAIMQIKKELGELQLLQAQSQALQDVGCQQNMVNQLRMLGGNGSIEHMLSSGAINAATARDMYMAKMANIWAK